MRINRCDIIAIGMIQAITEVGIKKPIVLRLKGTNIEEVNIEKMKYLVIFRLRRLLEILGSICSSLKI